MKRKFKANALWLALLGIVLSASSAHAGRFLSRDPKGTVDGPNVYGFCGGDPVNRTDPMGTDWKWVVPKGKNVWDGHWIYLEGTEFVNASWPKMNAAWKPGQNIPPEFCGLRDGEVWNSQTQSALSKCVFARATEVWRTDSSPLDAVYGPDAHRMHKSYSVQVAYDEFVMERAAGGLHSKLGFSGMFDLSGTSNLLNAQLYAAEGNSRGAFDNLLAAVLHVSGNAFRAGETAAEIRKGSTYSPLAETQIVKPPDRFPSSVRMNFSRMEMVSGNPETVITVITDPARMLPAPTLETTILGANQRFLNRAWIQQTQNWNLGNIVLNSGENAWTVLGRNTDAQARGLLRAFVAKQNIVEGPGSSLLINRWLRDPSGSGKWRVPDVYLPNERVIFENTIGQKTIMTPQIVDFRNFSGGARVIIITPTEGPGF